MRAIINLVSKYWWHLSVLVLAAITVLSLIPLPELPEFPGSDKTHHLVAYGVLMLPVALRQPKHWLLIACFFIAWSGAIELIQPYVNRYGEWMDLAANVGGLLLGVVIGFATNKMVVNGKKQ